MSTLGNAIEKISKGSIIKNSSMAPNNKTGLGLSPPTNKPDLIGNTRFFTFVLTNKEDNSKTSLKLNINPEEFNLDEPYRANAIQTKGGAFVDIWGSGIRRLSIKGTTGWHTQSQTDPPQVQDGYDNLFNFKNQIILKYFSIRDSMIEKYSSSEIDSRVILEIMDKLHKDTYQVVPEYFKLYRNKSRPLLHMYEASFIVVDDKVLSSVDALIGIKNTSIPGISHKLSNLQNKLSNLLLIIQLASLDIALGITMIKSVNLAQLICQIFVRVLTNQNVVGADIANIAFTVTQIASSIAQGIRNIENSLIISGVPADVQLYFWEIKHSFSEIACLLAHVQSAGLNTYTGIINSSACAAAYGLQTSTLDTSSNSFDLINSLSNGNNSSTNNAISSSSLVTVNKINSLDIPFVIIT